jgi:hypothetical protein
MNMRWGGKEGPDGGDGWVDEEVVRLVEGLHEGLLLLRAGRRVLEDTEEEAAVEGLRRRRRKVGGVWGG